MTIGSIGFKNNGGNGRPYDLNHSQGPSFFLILIGPDLKNWAYRDNRLFGSCCEKALPLSRPRALDTFLPKNAPGHTFYNLPVSWGLSISLEVSKDLPGGP